MSELEFYRSIREEDETRLGSARLPTPPYDAARYYRDIAQDPYFRSLVLLRHEVKRASDFYMGELVGAKNLDLFMLTPSISSPMGPGSDSEAIGIQFGNLHTYLVDSSQFGFEPLIVNGFSKVYCYLPSMRGEDPDDRHLNQFYHCEIEIAGTLEELMPIAEGYVKALSRTLMSLPITLPSLSENIQVSEEALSSIIASASFPRISFDEAWATLRSTGEEFVQERGSGRVITGRGEVELMRRLNLTTPLWILGYDRDTVPFYQKPTPKAPETTINADLVFPPLLPSGFAGEILGSGQRQDTEEEMRESLRRQEVKAEPYEWYIALRKLPGYRISSGFGLGIERFIAWALGKGSIRDVALYPRLKNILTIP